MASHTKVSVPQKDGEITVYTGDEPTTYTVTDGEVSVPNASVDHFLSVIDGAKASATPKKKEA